MSYNHLTIDERSCIEYNLRNGVSISTIARVLRRNKSTVSRELRRNKEKGEYQPVKAQAAYQERRKNCIPEVNIYEPLKEYIISNLKQRWSPEQIANRVKIEHPNDPRMRVSFTSIYNWIYREIIDFPKERLRFKGRTKPNNYQEKRGRFEIDLTIDKRLFLPEDRSEAGHWEIDTVIGKGRTGCLITLVERKSRLVIALPIKNKKMELVNQNILNIRHHIPKELFKSITSDRGKEFAGYREWGIPTYFADPYSPWQRGSNENTNGLLREFFPKGMDLSEVEPGEVLEAVNLINSRPRKCLNYKTAGEVFREYLLKAI